MSDLINLMEHTVIYILGAGASKSCGVPVMNDFVREGILYLDSDGNYDTINELLKFIRGEFGSNIQWDNNLVSDSGIVALRKFDRDVGIEKLLTKAVELENSKTNIVKKFIFQTIQSSAKFSVFSTPSSITKCALDKTLENCYHKFIVNIIKRDLENGYRVIFISFNYDELLERALLYNCLSRKFSYLVPGFKDRNNRTNFSDYEVEFNNGIMVLKLHGSLNWAFCNHCKRPHLYWYKKYTDIYDTACNNCQQKSLSHLLITPHIKKVYNDIFGVLLKEAGTFLAKANKVTIIGCSFREADNDAWSKLWEGIKENPNLLKLNLEIIDYERDVARRDNKKKEIWNCLNKHIPENNLNLSIHLDGFEGFVKK